MPAQINPATTSIESVAGAVRIQWTKPASNGAEITSYKVEFSTSAGWQTSSSCNGIAEVLLTQTCTVPMSEFSDTLSLTFNELIQVRV